MINIRVDSSGSKHWGGSEQFEGSVNTIPITASTVLAADRPSTAGDDDGDCPESVPRAVNCVLRIKPDQTFLISKAGANRSNEAQLTALGFCKVSSKDPMEFIEACSGEAFSAVQINDGRDLQVTPDQSQVAAGEVYLYFVQWKDAGGNYYKTQLTTNIISIENTTAFESPTVCLYTGSPGLEPDPSLPSDQGLMVGVSTEPETVDVEEGTPRPLTFTLGHSDLSFTGFRYMNTASENVGVWYQPKGGTTPGVEISPNAEFEYCGQVPTRSTDQNQKTLTIHDRASNEVVYLYVVEWKSDAEPDKFIVCDPKIKNEPPPDIDPDAAKGAPADSKGI